MYNKNIQRASNESNIDTTVGINGINNIQRRKDERVKK